MSDGNRTRTNDKPQQTKGETMTIDNTANITVTWDADSGCLHAECPDEPTLGSGVIPRSGPITASSDSWAIAEAVTQLTGAIIIDVEHDKEFVHVTVDNTKHMPPRYKIEGRINGVWDEGNVIVSGDPEDVNRFEHHSEAVAAMEKLVDVFAGQYDTPGQCRDDLRVVSEDVNE